MIRNKRSVIQAAILIGIVIIFIWCRPSVVQNNRDVTHRCTFDLESLKAKPWYSDICFDANLKLTIGKLDDNLQVWSQAIDRKCQILWSKFQDTFSVSVRSGTLRLPPKFEKTVRKWLGEDKNLMKSVYNQTVYHVRNLYTLEHTVYNPLRSMRPVSVSDISPRSYVSKLAMQTNSSCDFCNYKEMTAEDVFERIEGKLSVSAANTFKIDKWHGLFLTRKHNPLDLNEEDVLDLFNTSLKWFHKVNEIDPTAMYPVLIWDSLPHAGASQLHPHLHGMMDSLQYYGAAHIQYESAKKYFKYTGNNYWDDFIEIHHALGLAVIYKSAIAVAPLTSKKDHELLLLSDGPTVDLFRLLFYVIKTYEHFQMYCFSTGIALPSFNSQEGSKHPAMIRIGTRGDCSSIRSDISSLELYSVNNVNVDPYKTIASLQKTVAAYLSKDSPHSVMVSWP